MNKPKPDVIEALQLGYELGLNTVGDAIDNYMNHYTLFFYLPEYKTQYAEFIKELEHMGLMQDGKLLALKQITDVIKNVDIAL